MVLFLLSIVTLLGIKSEFIQNTFTSDATSLMYSITKENEAITEVQCTANSAINRSCVPAIWSKQMGSTSCSLLVNQGDNCEVFNSNSSQSQWVKKKENASRRPSTFSRTGCWCIFVGITSQSWSASEDICQSYGSHIHLADIRLRTSMRNL